MPRAGLLKQPTLGEALGNLATDNQMIKDADVNERERFFQTLGYQLIGPRGLRDTARVVVGQDHCCRVVRERPLDHFSWVNVCSIERSPKQFLAGKEAISIVQIKASENCSDPVKSCSGIDLRGMTHGYIDGRRDQTLDSPT